MVESILICASDWMLTVSTVTCYRDSSASLLIRFRVMSLLMLSRLQYFAVNKRILLLRT